MQILDGKKLSVVKQVQIKVEIDNLFTSIQRKPSLVVVLVGNDEASKTYVEHKTKMAQKVGILAKTLKLDQNISPNELYQIIDELNQDTTVDGILLQLPLPSNFDEEQYLQAIIPQKDVDGFHYLNQGKMLQGYPTIYPCTPLGVINLLKEYNISIQSKNVVVIGTSNIVGKPLSIMLSNLGATVTMCNKNTKNIKKHTKSANIVISATGKQFIIKRDMIKKGAIVIDIGITRDQKTNKLVGDVEFEKVKSKASFITPVPGGVGPMTVITLMENTLTLFKEHIKVNN